MTLADWYNDHVKEGKGWHEALYQLYLGAWRRVGRNVYNYGTPIWDDDWDVMLILDACRYDLMQEVADEYDFISTVDSRYSLGSTSPEWMDKNFAEEFDYWLSGTAYVTGNLFSQEHLDPSAFYSVDEVWQYAWNDDLGTVRPESMTDRAIDVWRTHSPTRMLVHYMQPHHPFIDDPIGEGMAAIDEFQRDVWDMMRQDEDVTRDDVWPRYANNLRTALDSVEVLLDNIDAENVVITADHGNLAGEYGLYGHPSQVPLPPVKRVPWVETTANDVGDYEPSIHPEVDPERETTPVEEKLEALGYK